MARKKANAIEQAAVAELRSDKAEAIEDYIAQHSQATLERKQPYELNGERADLQVYRLPLDLLTYNIKNGRFAAELREVEAELSRALDPENGVDIPHIEALLLKDTKRAGWLEDDIVRVGQLSPGSITADGFVVDGNRRLAVLKRLRSQRAVPKYGFFETVRLPPNVSREDVWRIEAGLQLSTDLKVSYGPINELLKIREGKEYGLKEREISLVLGADYDEETVEYKLKRLALIEDYLQYFSLGKRYSEVEKNVEHFINIQKYFMANRAWAKDYSPSEQVEVLHALFQAIRCGEAHLRIRAIAGALKTKPICIGIVRGILKTANRSESAEVPQTSRHGEVEAELDLFKSAIAAPPKLVTPPPLLVEIPEEPGDDNGASPTMETPADAKARKELKQAIDDVIDDGLEKVDAQKEKRRPEKLLGKTLTVLDALLTYERKELQAHRPKVEEVLKKAKKLVEKFGA